MNHTDIVNCKMGLVTTLLKVWTNGTFIWQVIHMWIKVVASADNVKGRNSDKERVDKESICWEFEPSVECCMDCNLLGIDETPHSIQKDFQQKAQSYQNRC